MKYPGLHWDFNIKNSLLSFYPCYILEAIQERKYSNLVFRSCQGICKNMLVWMCRSNIVHKASRSARFHLTWKVVSYHGYCFFPEEYRDDVNCVSHEGRGSQKYMHYKCKTPSMKVISSLDSFERGFTQLCKLPMQNAPRRIYRHLRLQGFWLFQVKLTILLIVWRCKPNLTSSGVLMSVDGNTDGSLSARNLSINFFSCV